MRVAFNKPSVFLCACVSRYKKRVVDIPAARAEQAAAAEATPPSADEPGPNDGNSTAPGFRKV